MNIPAINVWTATNAEARLDRIAKQARDVEETCQRMLRLASQLKVRAQRGDRSAEQTLAVLVDESYESLSSVLLMESDRGQ